MTPSRILYERLRANGLDFFVSVPCKFLSQLIQLAEQDRAVIHTPVTREEEGIGILAGAFMAGRRPAMFLQNSGLGNSVNALCSLANYYRIGLLLVISHRGTAGEKIAAQEPMGRATPAVLAACDVPWIELRQPGDVERSGAFIQRCFADTRPGALLIPVGFWSGGTGG